MPTPSSDGTIRVGRLNYVLHCLPGPQASKAAAVRHVAEVITPDGVLFGATVLGTPELHTRLSAVPLRSTAVASSTIWRTLKGGWSRYWLFDSFHHGGRGGFGGGLRRHPSPSLRAFLSVKTARQARRPADKNASARRTGEGGERVLHLGG